MKQQSGSEKHKHHQHQRGDGAADAPLCLLAASDLFKYRFVDCKLINSSFIHNKEGCILDFSDDFNNAYMIYFVNFLGTLAVLPGNIVSALLMDKIGRLRMLGKEVPTGARGSPAAGR